MYVAGRSKQTLPITSATVVRLGGPDGVELVLQPVDVAHPSVPPYAAALLEQQARTSRRLRQHTFALGVLFVLAVAGSFNATRISDYFRNQQLEDAERATVRLVIRDEGGEIRSWGSGTIVDSRGLILTNAHVAAPGVPGLQLRYGLRYPSPEPKSLEVWTVAEDQDFAEPAYRARLVVADGWLDLAVVRITRALDGDPLPADFPVVDIGPGGGMSRGDTVHAVGYPRISGGAAQRITSGSVAAWRDESRVVGSTKDIIDTTANITGGSSGGALVDGQGRLIAVPMGSLDDLVASVSAGWARPVEFADPLLEAALSTPPSTYASPFLVHPSGHETAELVGWGDLRSDGTCDPSSQSPPLGVLEVCAQFIVANMRPNLDVLLGLVGIDRAWSAQRVSAGQSKLTFRLELSDPLTSTPSWRLDVGGGQSTLVEFQPGRGMVAE